MVSLTFHVLCKLDYFLFLSSGDCEKSGLVNTSADESLFQNIQKIVVVRGNSSSADPIIYILYGDTAEKVGSSSFRIFNIEIKSKTLLHLMTLGLMGII